MADNTTQLPIKTESKSVVPSRPRYHFDSLRNEIDRLFDDFGTGFWRSPFDRSWLSAAPFRFATSTDLAVDIAEKDGIYEVTAELPGINEKDIDISVTDGGLSIKAQKNEEKKEEKKGYVLSERRYGSFERRFGIPAGVDVDKISAAFKNGVLTVTLPKSVEAQKHEKKIAVKAA